MMSVDYNTFAKSFAKSRKNMKWAELEYFFSQIKQGSILDVGCGSGRLLEQYKEQLGKLPDDYLGIDMSQDLLYEAQKNFPNSEFSRGNMLNIKSICQGKTFQNIFLIASFHHLETILDRQNFLNDLSFVMQENSKIYMTNWALNSSINDSKYAPNVIPGSENEYGGVDYNIRFGNHDRFYHCFSILELETLCNKAGFKIYKNELYQGGRNIITILEK